MKVTALFGGFVGHDGVPTLLTVGEEWDAEHPVVKAHPEMFTEPKRGPGRPPATVKPKPAND